MGTLSPEVKQEARDEAAMWVDLLSAHNAAESAEHRVTRRAELFLRVGGLPLEKVLDALRTDEAGWVERLADLRANEARNLAAADERARTTEQQP